MKDFNPIRLPQGQFCISLNLTTLREQAWDVLRLAEQLGFPKPQFQGFQRGDTSEVWAILVQETHDYTQDSLEDLLQAWESQVDQLAESLPDFNKNLLIAGRFEKDLAHVHAGVH